MNGQKNTKPAAPSKPKREDMTAFVKRRDEADKAKRR